MGSREPSVRVFRSSLGWRAFWQMLGLVSVGLSMVIGLLTPLDGYLRVLQVALLVVAIGLCAWLVWGTYYRIENGTLTVRRLFLRKRIPLGDIRAVRRRPYPIWHGSPGDRDYALGTWAIEVELSGCQVLVSPRDEEGFLAALDRGVESPGA